MATPPPVSRPGVHGRFRARRHNRRMLRDNIKAIGKPSISNLPIRRLARRGGVKRIKIDIYDKVREVLKSHVEEILRRVTQVIMISGASKGILKANGEVDESRNGRKTVTTDDIVFVLRQMGTPLYGFGWYALGAEKRQKIRAGRA